MAEEAERPSVLQLKQRFETSPVDLRVPDASKLVQRRRKMSAHEVGALNAPPSEEMNTMTLPRRGRMPASPVSPCASVNSVSTLGGSVATLTADSPSDEEPPPHQSTRPRSKSKSRGLVQRSGSVLKSWFGPKGERSANSPPSKADKTGSLSYRQTLAAGVKQSTSWQFGTGSLSEGLLLLSGGKDLVKVDLERAVCEPIEGNKKKNEFRIMTRHMSEWVLSTNEGRNDMLEWIAAVRARIQTAGASPDPPVEGPLPHLETHNCSSAYPLVPLVVSWCCDALDSRWLNTQGLYRVPGNTANVSRLIQELLRGQNPVWALDDPHVCSSAIKSFLRRLPEPLVTEDWHNSLLVAHRSSDRLNALKRVLREMNPSHRATLAYLTAHLRRVTSNSASNKMDASNLAIVFGPTLLRSRRNSSDMMTMWQDMTGQSAIIETIIEHGDWLFESEESRSASSLPDVVRDSESRSDVKNSVRVEKPARVEARQLHLRHSSSPFLRTNITAKSSESVHNNGATLSASVSSVTVNNPKKKFPSSHSLERESDSCAYDVSKSCAYGVSESCAYGVSSIGASRPPPPPLPASHSPKSTHKFMRSGTSPMLNPRLSTLQRSETLQSGSSTTSSCSTPSSVGSSPLHVSASPSIKSLECPAKLEGDMLFSEFLSLTPDAKDGDDLELFSSLTSEFDEKLSSLRTEYLVTIENCASLDSCSDEQINSATNAAIVNKNDTNTSKQPVFIENKAFVQNDDSEKPQAVLRNFKDPLPPKPTSYRIYDQVKSSKRNDVRQVFQQSQV